MDGPTLAPEARCPRCRGGLVPLSHTELNELRCAHCQGAWLDARGVEQLGNDLGMRARTFIARLREALPPLLGALPCIRCQRAMSRLKLRTVEVDACASCGGMWLDAGELPTVSSGRYGDPSPGEVRARVMSEADTRTFLELKKLQRALEPQTAVTRLRVAAIVEALEEIAVGTPLEGDREQLLARVNHAMEHARGQAARRLTPVQEAFEKLVARLLGPPPG